MEKMLQNPKVLQSTVKCLHHPKPPPSPLQIQQIPTSPAPAVLNQCLKLSRRELAVCTKSSMLLLLTSQFQDRFCSSKARAEEEGNLLTMEKPEVEEKSPIENNNITSEENAVESNAITSEENAVEASRTTVEENAVENNVTMAEENVGEDSAVKAEENVAENGTIKSVENTDSCTDRALTKRAFLDISIDGQPIGRIIIGLYGNSVPVGTARFGDFVSGAAGISYRKKEFVKIMPNYVQHGGVRSYGVDAELAAKTGRNSAVKNLVDEFEKENGKCPGVRNVAGSVGIIVKDPFKPPPKQKLVARSGKLEIDEEEIGKDPNGTEFVISMKDSPELDASTLVIGKVIDGMEVVERIGQVKTVQENTGSPYFRVAKLIGDKRAVVAERGFNRPYSKVVVTNCGLMV